MAAADYFSKHPHPSQKALELLQSAETLFFVGQAPNGLNASSLGKYLRVREGLYELEGNSDVKLHLTKGKWWIGPTPGEWIGAFHVDDGPPCPSRIAKCWQTAAPSGWVQAPGVQLVAADPRASSSDGIYLVGDIGEDMLGKYEKMRANDGRLCELNGR